MNCFCSRTGSRSMKAGSLIHSTRRADARRARPAGSIFQQDGKLVRPAQDCSHRYGYGIRMMEIVTLDEERYQESEIASYTPDWDGNVVGLHTIHRNDGFTVLDVKQSTLRFRNS